MKISCLPGEKKEEERNRQVLTYLYFLIGGICAGVIVAIYIYFFCFLPLNHLSIIIKVKSLSKTSGVGLQSFLYVKVTLTLRCEISKVVFYT